MTGLEIVYSISIPPVPVVFDKCVMLLNAPETQGHVCGRVATDMVKIDGREYPMCSRCFNLLKGRKCRVRFIRPPKKSS